MAAELPDEHARLGSEGCWIEDERIHGALDKRVSVANRLRVGRDCGEIANFDPRSMSCWLAHARAQPSPGLDRALSAWASGEDPTGAVKTLPEDRPGNASTWPLQRANRAATDLALRLLSTPIRSTRAPGSCFGYRWDFCFQQLDCVGLARTTDGLPSPGFEKASFMA